MGRYAAMFSISYQIVGEYHVVLQEMVNQVTELTQIQPHPPGLPSFPAIRLWKRTADRGPLLPHIALGAPHHTTGHQQ